MSATVRSLKKVGEFFGRCERTARRWARSGMPRKAGGVYDLLEIEKWLAKKHREGIAFSEMGREEASTALFEVAVAELREGLRHLCQSYIIARGKTRARLVDQAVRSILQGTLRQVGLQGLLPEPEKITDPASPGEGKG